MFGTNTLPAAHVLDRGLTSSSSRYGTAKRNVAHHPFNLPHEAHWASDGQQNTSCSPVAVLKQYSYFGVLEILPVLLQVDNEVIFLVLVYRQPGPIGDFVNNITQVVDQILRENPISGEFRTMILGDFNWDQLLPEHVASLTPFSSHFNLFQRSNYSTHIKGGILDLVFDDKLDSDVQWMFSPFSDHFVLLIDL